MGRGRHAGYEDQRELILAQAATLFAQRGYPGTSMNQVAEACGLSKATLYHYYRDKYEMLVSIADGHVTRLQSIVSEALAGRLWPGKDTIGRRLREAEPGQHWREVVGVVRDAKYARLTEEPRGACYAPVWQRAASPLSLVVRTSGDSPAVLSTLAEIAHGLDRNLPLFRAQTLEDSIRRTVNLQRAAASALGVFGALALMLASIGVYGVVAHSVSMRTREVGIRLSLGARAADVFRMFFRESLSLAFIGVAIGLGLSAATSRLLTSFLFGLTATDGITFIGGSLVLCLVAIGATYVPARRAAHFDPLVALRHE